MLINEHFSILSLIRLDRKVLIERCCFDDFALLISDSIGRLTLICLLMDLLFSFMAIQISSFEKKSYSMRIISNFPV